MNIINIMEFKNQTLKTFKVKNQRSDNQNANLKEVEMIWVSKMPTLNMIT